VENTGKLMKPKSEEKDSLALSEISALLHATLFAYQRNLETF
jgi:hypothetical protein